MAEKPSEITGDGTIASPYIVHNYDEIKWACEDAEAIPEGQTASIPVCIKLNNDIDCQTYAQDFEWAITCQHSMDIDLNSKTIQTFYIVAKSYMFNLASTVTQFDLHDGAILNIYGNWFDPSYAIFYINSVSSVFNVTNVSFSINASQFSNTDIIVRHPHSEAARSITSFANCAFTIEGVLQPNVDYLFYYVQLFTCDFMLNVSARDNNFVPYATCILQDCRVQGVVDDSAKTVSTGHYGLCYGALNIARNCVFDVEIILPTIVTTEKQFLENSDSTYNYGIYNRDKLSPLIVFTNTNYIECTTEDMDMRVNPHADVTLQEKGFDVIKG